VIDLAPEAMSPSGLPGPAETPVLEARGIRKRFGGVVALKGIDVSFRAGEIHAVVGENGAGKSTLNAILTGVYPPDEGTILIRGQETQFGSPGDAERAGIAAVYQELSLIEELDVASNVLLHHEPRRWGPILDRRQLYERCRDILESLGILSINPRAPVWALSVADRQLVELARALSRQARFVIMDEPTAALAADDQERLFTILDDLRRRGSTVLYVSHRLEEVFRSADRVTVLRDGQVIATRTVSETSHDELIRLMVGRDLAHHLFPARRASPPAAGPGIEAAGISSPGRFEDVSLAVRPGEIVGLAGLIGAGRTSVLRALFGADPIAAGEIRLFGEPVTLKSPRDGVAKGIALLAEDRRVESLALRLNIVENVTAVELPSRAGVVDDGRSRSVAKTATEEVRLSGNLRRTVRDLSGGNQQKVALAKWLSIRPKIILCDEPTRGIDVAAKAEIYALLRRLADDGAAVLFASSELPEVLGLADRILVMHEGRLTAEFDGATASETSVLRAASGLAD